VFGTRGDRPTQSIHPLSQNQFELEGEAKAASPFFPYASTNTHRMARLMAYVL